MPWQRAERPADAAPLQRARAEAVGLFLRQWRPALVALLVVTGTVFFLALDQAGRAPWDTWFLLTLGNTLAQAAVARMMEKAPTLADADRRWMPWLVASIALNGVLWGTLPWLAASASPTALVLACLLNIMLLFCVINAHGTTGMQRAATWSIAPVTCLSALLAGHYRVATVFALLAGMLDFYGWRVRHALQAATLERYDAQRLAAELQASHALLQANQQQLVVLERERTLLLERQRLMRDMHDGIGSTLVSSLAAVERGTLDADEMGAVLRDCLDELRTVIDSLDPTDHDLVAMLATLRRRLERRLDTGGVRLRWHVGDLPVLPWLGAPEALHVMRIVQEVLANVVKHAQARHVRLAAVAVPGGVEIALSDDGRGFDPASVQPGRGLRSLQGRAGGAGRNAGCGQRGRQRQHRHADLAAATPAFGSSGLRLVKAA